MTALPSLAPSTSYVAPGVHATNGIGANARTDASAMKTSEDATAVQVCRVTGPPRRNRPQHDVDPRRFGHSAACDAIYPSEATPGARHRLWGLRADLCFARNPDAARG